MTQRMKKDLLKSLIHALEVAIFGALALAAFYLVKDDADIMAAIKDAIINIIPVAAAAFIAKLNRATDKTGTRDYVNDI